MYRNYEGYSDPTAGQAIGNLMREYRQEQRARRRRQKEIPEGKEHVEKTQAGKEAELDGDYGTGNIKCDV